MLSTSSAEPSPTLRCAKGREPLGPPTQRRVLSPPTPSDTSQETVLQRRNFFDTPTRAVSLRTLFAGTKRSHGRSNCKFDAALGLLSLWQGVKPVRRSA